MITSRALYGTDQRYSYIGHQFIHREMSTPLAARPNSAKSAELQIIIWFLEAEWELFTLLHVHLRAILLSSGTLHVMGLARRASHRSARCA